MDKMELKTDYSRDRLAFVIIPASRCFLSLIPHASYFDLVIEI